MADRQEMAQLTPNQVAGYLRARGWRRMRRYANTWVWRLPEHNLNVLLPEDADFEDYPQRMWELLTTVAESEGRDSADLLYTLREPMMDVHHIRTMPDSPSGTTPLEDAARAVKGLRDLFSTAARWVLLDRPTTAELPAGRIAGLDGFLDRLRMRVPVPGSYVMRVEAPIPDGADDGSARDISRSVYGMVAAANRGAAASVEVGNPGPFGNEIANGVTSQLCEALADLGGKSRSAFEFRADWSWRSPVDLPTEAVSFTTNHVAALHVAKVYLHRLASTVPATVVGYTDRLEHKRSERGGQVIFLSATIRMPDGTEQDRWVRATLNPRQYEQARAAHTIRPIRLTGQLATTGRQWKLTDITELAIMDEPTR